MYDLNYNPHPADDEDVMSQTFLAPDATQFLLDPDSLDPCELTVVMPVYNEEASLPACAESWITVLDELNIDYRLLVINDGSTDTTAVEIDRLNRHERVFGVTKSNEGHGPTILRGYHVGARSSKWVFQVDSDDEIPASAFPPVWAARQDVQAVFGVRSDRHQSLDRKAISRIAKLTNKMFLKGRVSDVNVPFRLMLSEALLPVIDQLPEDTFAPNIVISGALGRDRDSFVELSVPHQQRQAGEVSIVGWGAIKAAGRSFVQTVRLSRTI